MRIDQIPRWMRKSARATYSLRGHGKGSVTEVGGKSKKDRLFITAELRK